MHILYLSQYFPPEAGATQNRAFEMATHLARLGHVVTVLCEVPNHPSGIVAPGFRARRQVRRTERGVDIRHLWVYARAAKTFRSRLLFYLSYMIHAVMAGLFVRKVDVVYASSPPLFVAAAGRMLAFCKRCRFVMEVRDIWPEAAVQLGELKSGRALRLARRLELGCYDRADRIVVVTEGARRHLSAERAGRYAGRLALIPNGANCMPDPNAAETAIRQTDHTPFVVLYAGLIGIAQGLETLLEAARRVSSRPVVAAGNPAPAPIEFRIVGDGPAKAELESQARALALTNLRWLPAVPVERMPEVYAQADAAIVPLRRLPLFADTVPSKLYDAMAAGLPVLLGVEGEALRLLEAAGGGLGYEPENAAALLAVIEVLRADTDAARRMGRRGREFVRRHYSREAQAEALERLLLSL